MPYVGDAPSIVDDIANELEYDIPAPIRDESELEPFDMHVEGVAITEQTGTFMHVEAFAMSVGISHVHIMHVGGAHVEPNRTVHTNREASLRSTYVAH